MIRESEGTAHRGEMTSSVAQVESTLHVFYNGATNEEQRQQAHSWLVDLQQSQSAWKISLHLLAESAELTAQLFGVNCLYGKLLRSWNDLSDDLPSVITLRDFLWTRVYDGQYPVLVRDRLASCLAILVLQTIPDVWEDPLTTVINESDKSDRHLYFSLNVLAAIPYNFRRVGMDLQRKGVVRTELRKHIASLRVFLTAKYPVIFTDGQRNIELAESAINCLENWLEFESDLNDWSDLVTFCLSPQISASISDDLFGPISRLFQNIAGNIVLNQFEKLALHMYEFVASLLSANVDKALRAEDLEVCATLAKMVSTLVENHAKFLLSMESSHPEVFLTVMAGLLKLTVPPLQYPLDEQFSSLPLRSWFAIYEDLTTCTMFTKIVSHDPNFSGDVTVRDECARLKVVLRPFYLNLLDSSLRYKLRLVETFESWSAADKENFYTYRREFADVLVVIQRCFPGDYVAAVFPYLHLGEATTSASISVEREVGFYALSSVAENVQDEKLLEPVFAALACSAYDTADVCNAALRVVTSYSSVVVDCGWFAYVLPFVIRSLANRETVTLATLAFKDLAESRDTRFFDACVQALQPESPIYLFRKLYSCVEDKTLEPADCIRALHCIGLAVSYLPPNEVSEILNELISPKLDRLQAIADGYAGAYPSKDALLEELDFLAALVGSINPVSTSETSGSAVIHPVFVIMQRCLPIFPPLFGISGRSPDVAEKMCHILQISLTALAATDSVALCAPYCELVTILYMDPGQRDLPASSVVLPVVRKLFLAYGQTLETREILRNLLDNLAMNTVAFEATRNVDLYENFLAMIQNVCRKHPTFFAGLPAESLIPIMKMCIGGLSFNESSVLKQSSFCFSELFKTATTPGPLNEFMDSFLSEHGASMSHQVFERMKLEPLVSGVEYLADTLFHMVKYFPRYLQLYLSALPGHHLVTTMMQETSNKRKFREFAKRINLAVRKEQIQI